MSNEKIEYEPVPLDKLQEQDAFHANSITPSDSLEYGGAALAGKGAYELAKRTPGVKKLFPEVTIGPITTEAGVEIPKVSPTGVSATKPIPTTVGQFYDPLMVSENGLGPGAAKNRLHNFDQAKGAELNAKFLANPEPGFQLEGNRVIATPIGADTNLHPPVVAAQPVEPPKPVPLTPAQRAMQVAQGIGGKAMNALSHPIMQKLNPAFIGLGYIGAGTSAKEAYERAQHGDYGRAAIDALGGVGTLASILAPHPAAKVLGLGTGLGAHYLNKKLDEKYGRDYATGGLVYLGK